MTSPQFQHDCGKCQFLGQHMGADLYAHWDGDGALQTVIARFGSEGPEYTSGLALADLDPHLCTALRLAYLRNREGVRKAKLLPQYFLQRLEENSWV